MGTAILNARSEVEASLAEGALTAPGGETIQPAVQRELLGILTGAPGEEVPALARALGSGANANAHEAAEVLAIRLGELGESPMSLGKAVASYNAFIEASSEDLLRNPPARLLALQTALRTMVDAAFRAAGETGGSNPGQD